MKNNFSVGEECKNLLASIKSKRYPANILAKEFFDSGESGSKSVPSIITKFSLIKSGSIKDKSISKSLLSFLKKRDSEIRANNDHDTTIVFYFWSEGSNDMESEDRLKIGYVQFNLKDINSRNESSSTLCYQDDMSLVYGEAFFIPAVNILEFYFSQGTSLFMSVPNNLKDCLGKFYKGTYAATPGPYTCSGIGLFEMIKETDIKKLREIENDKKERIKAELYKKRFLVLNNRSVYSHPSEFMTADSFNELEDIAGPYIRYRRSGSSERIHGDLVKIEKFGRVIYRGPETDNRHGRCFIQKDREEKDAKNLIIELFQEADTEKKGFEFRSPHSFMMFDISKATTVIVGYTLRPKKGFIPHGSKCFLIKIKIDDWEESYFKPIEFFINSAGELSDKDIASIERLHSIKINKKKIQQLFFDL